MGLFVKNIFNATSSAAFPPRDPALAALFGNNRSESGEIVTPDTATQVTAVLASVAVIAESIAPLPLFIYNRDINGGKTLDIRNPLTQILHTKPNKWQTAMEYWEMKIGHTLLWGNAFSWIKPSGTRGVDELIPLRPDRVTPFMAPDGRVAYGYQPPNGEQIVFLQNEIFRLGGLSTDGTKAPSRIERAADSIGLAMIAEKHASRFFKNDARPAGILEHPTGFKEHIDPQGDYQTFKRSWEAAQSGDNHGKTAILEEGLTYKELGVPNKDAQFLETREFQVADIARIFKVPPHMIGDLRRATFSNIEQQSIEFVTYTLVPWVVRIEQAISRDLFTDTMRREMQFAEFTVDALLRGDKKSRFESYQIARMNGWMNTDEIRAKENMNPIGGTDGSTYLVPANLTTVDKILTGSVGGGGFSNNVNKLIFSNSERLAVKEMKAVSRIHKSEKDEGIRAEKLAEFYSKHKDILMETYQLDDATAVILCDDFMAEAVKGNIKVAERANKLFRIGVESYGQNEFSTINVEK